MGEKRRSGARRIFTRYMQEKLAITVIVITLALFALIYVLYHIITTKQDSYNQIVLSQQQYDSRVLPYRRGDIVDRNGTYLATTEKVYNLIIDPKQIMSAETDYLDATVTALVTVFDYDETEMKNLIRIIPERRICVMRNSFPMTRRKRSNSTSLIPIRPMPRWIQRPVSRESGLKMNLNGSILIIPWPVM